MREKKLTKNAAYPITFQPEREEKMIVFKNCD